MNSNKRIRQVHRWLGIVFTVTVLVDLVAALQGSAPVWVFYLPLLPLVLQLLTGLYLFVAPYVARRRGAQPAVGES